jgi:hypothetical protein
MGDRDGQGASGTQAAEDLELRDTLRELVELDPHEFEQFEKRVHAAVARARLQRTG